MIQKRIRKVLEESYRRYRLYGLSGLARSVAGRLRRCVIESKWPQYDNREVEALTAVLASRSWGGPYPGKHGARFAQAFAQFHGAKHGICCNSGTTALVVALKAIGVGRGDEVLVPALTFAATATAVLEVGATPVFVDVDPQTWCIDHRLISAALTPRTKAILPVHLGSRMADMDEIVRLADEYDLNVVEDAAHMHGGKWRDRGAGSMGDLGCFSFQNSKTMTAGEGGIILTTDDDLATRCHAYVNLGRLPEDKQPQSILGSNLRITEFQAALLLVQLERLQEHIEIRSRNYALFDGLLQDIDGVSPLKQDERVSVYAGYGYYFKYFPEQCGGVPRDRFLADLEGYGVVATPGWMPVYYSPEFGWQDNTVQSSYSEVSCPIAEKAARENSVWILHQKFLATEKEMQHMGHAIARLVAKYRKARFTGKRSIATTS
jgi:dTDP-4-amino-4,6-dideoxygalactose transaminase